MKQNKNHYVVVSNVKLPDGEEIMYVSFEQGKLVEGDPMEEKYYKLSDVAKMAQDVAAWLASPDL